MALACLGEFVRVRAMLERRQRDLRQRGALYHLVHLQLGLQNLAWFAGDDPDRVRADVNEALSHCRESGYFGYLGHMSRIQAYLYDQNPEAALNQVETKLEHAAREHDALHMSADAAIARHQLGSLLGRAEGRALQTRQENFLRDMGVVRPDRMADLMLPLPA